MDEVFITQLKPQKCTFTVITNTFQLNITKKTKLIMGYKCN